MTTEQAYSTIEDLKTILGEEYLLMELIKMMSLADLEYYLTEIIALHDL